jgi:hypothetical protein
MKKYILLFAFFCINTSVLSQISIYDKPATQNLIYPDYGMLIRMMELQQQQLEVERRRNELQIQQSNPNAPSCDNLIENLESNGIKLNTVTPIELINSNWLYSVTEYKIGSKIIVIAEIKKEKNSYITKKYIFCEVPEDNWTYFYYGIYDTGLTYGERFQKYIIDFKCDCN